jgi:hypothetical protein
MARQAWALARAWPKTFFFVWKKKTEKNIGKRAKWANQQSEHNLKTSFTLSLLSLARHTYRYSHTLKRPPPRRALFDHHASVTTGKASNTSPQPPPFSLCSEKPLHK